MFTLMQIILFLNTSDLPRVTLLTHLDNLDKCEKKIYEAYDRYNKSGIKVFLKKDEEKNIVLELKDSSDTSIIYMFCKKAIFLK